VQLLRGLQVLEARPLLIHCVRVNAMDLHAIADSRSSVAHCPASNAKLGHGIAPLREMLDAGIAIGLGSDSVASNNRMDLLDEARLAVLQQRSRTARHDAVTAAQALDLATRGGARALGLDADVGTLEPGKAADLAAFPLDPRAMPAHDPEAAAVFALHGTPAQLVTVAGRELVRDGRLLVADPGLPARVQRTGDRLQEWLTRNR
jgi:5-methylthioadenosine/S-adenosylhomocysteine deaminase